MPQSHLNHSYTFFIPPPFMIMNHKYVIIIPIPPHPPHPMTADIPPPHFFVLFVRPILSCPVLSSQNSISSFSLSRVPRESYTLPLPYFSCIFRNGLLLSLINDPPNFTIAWRYISTFFWFFFLHECCPSSLSLDLSIYYDDVYYYTRIRFICLFVFFATMS